MADPQFSIVLPTFNRADLLRRAIRSVLDQTCPDWELLVVDDGSTDGTHRVLSEFPEPRIRATSLPRNLGVAAARNTAIRMSRGHWVSFLDDDDEYDAHFLQATRDYLGRCGAGLSWTGVAFLTEGVKGGDVIRRVWAERTEGTLQERQRAQCDLVSIGLSYGVTVRRALLLSIGFLDEGLRVAQDTDFFLRYLGSGEPFGSIPEVLVRHHIHPGDRLTGRKNDRVRLEALRTIVSRHGATILSNSLIRETFEAADRRLCERLKE